MIKVFAMFRVGETFRTSVLEPFTETGGTTEALGWKHQPGDGSSLVLEYTQRVGDILVEFYGEKKFYSILEIKAASSMSGKQFNLTGWAIFVFASSDDFKRFCDESPAEEVIIIDPMGDKGHFEKNHRAHLIATACLHKLKERILLTSPGPEIASVCEQASSEVDCPSRVKQLCLA